MGKILNFPGGKFAPLTVRKGRKHWIVVEVLDRNDARRTRWILQFEIQEVAGYGPAIDGFTDLAVAAGYRHGFEVTSTRAVREFGAATATLVSEGKIAVSVDGQRVQPRIRRHA